MEKRGVSNTAVILLQILWLVAYLTATQALATSREDKIAELETKRESLLQQVKNVEDELQRLREETTSTEEEDSDAEPHPEYGTFEGAVLRRGPGKRFKVLEKIPSGTMLRVMGYEKEYWKVSYKGKVGYVANEFFDAGSDVVSWYERRNHERSLQEVAKARKDGKKLLIHDVSVEEINSADGVDIKIDWINFEPKKKIKYIHFTVIPYNAVGDQQSSQMGGHSEFTGRAVGPIEAMDEYTTYHWETAWYNSSISCLRLASVRVEYTDGSKLTFSGKSLPTILSKDVDNSCKYEN